MVVVPVTSVSLLAEHVLSEALSLGDEVIAVTVVFDGEAARPSSPTSRRGGRSGIPGCRSACCTPQYASVVRPILGFVDDLRAHHDKQVVVLIPVVVPDRLRYRLLHNQIDLALASQLHRRPDVVVARVPMPIHHDDPGPEGDGGGAGTGRSPARKAR